MSGAAEGRNAKDGPETRDALSRASARARELGEALDRAAGATQRAEEIAAFERARADAAHALVERRSDAIRAAEQRATAAELRLARLHALLPFRIYDRLREMPPVSWVVARRRRAFDRELERRRAKGGDRG